MPRTFCYGGSRVQSQSILPKVDPGPIPGVSHDLVIRSGCSGEDQVVTWQAIVERVCEPRHVETLPGLLNGL